MKKLNTYITHLKMVKYRVVRGNEEATFSNAKKSIENILESKTPRLVYYRIIKTLDIMKMGGYHERATDKCAGEQ